MEVSAVGLALAYVVLAIYQQRLCWLAAMASALLYIAIFWRVQLYLEAALQLFYIAMAIGWRSGEMRTTAWSQFKRGHTAIMRRPVALLLLSLMLGGAMQTFTDAASPFIDAGTTVSALATWMVARKLLENWLYWIAIDLASIGLYLSRDLTLTAVLFGGYVILAGLGYRTWRRQWLAQRTA